MLLDRLSTCKNFKLFLQGQASKRWVYWKQEEAAIKEKKDAVLFLTPDSFKREREREGER